MLWHLGEPLALGLEFYKRAADIFEEFGGRCRITQAFQTNGTLVSPAFATWARRVDARVGISIDGPAFLHDAERHTRGGRGTHAKAFYAFRMLRSAGVAPSAIAVITRRTLGHAKAFFEFFSELRPSELALNVEEIDGTHRRHSLGEPEVIAEYKTFMIELYSLWAKASWMPPIREFARLRSALLHADATRSSLRTPLAIVSVDVDGYFSTFSPELLLATDNGRRPFVFGHVERDSIGSILANPDFFTVAAAIGRGVHACQKSCDYFSVCGGGTPSNKYFATGGLDVTETQHCRIARQATTDALLPLIEGEFAVAGDVTPSVGSLTH